MRRGSCRGSGAVAAAPLTDLEFLGEHAKIDLDAVSHNSHRVRIHGKNGRQRLHLTAHQVETSTVSWTLHQAVFQLAFAENSAVVRTDVVDRAPAAILAMPEAEAPALGLDDTNPTRWDVRRVGDTDVPAQAAAPSTSAI